MFRVLPSMECVHINYKKSIKISGHKLNLKKMYRFKDLAF